MANLYQVEIMVAATVYVKAATYADAIQQVRAFHMDAIELPEGEFCDGLPVSGAQFDSEHLPDISLSPAMTIHVNSPVAFQIEDETR